MNNKRFQTCFIAGTRHLHHNEVFQQHQRLFQFQYLFLELRRVNAEYGIPKFEIFALLFPPGVQDRRQQRNPTVVGWQQ